MVSCHLLWSIMACTQWCTINDGQHSLQKPHHIHHDVECQWFSSPKPCGATIIHAAHHSVGWDYTCCFHETYLNAVILKCFLKIGTNWDPTACKHKFNRVKTWLSKEIWLYFYHKFFIIIFVSICFQHIKLAFLVWNWDMHTSSLNSFCHLLTLAFVPLSPFPTAERSISIFPINYHLFCSVFIIWIPT